MSEAISELEPGMLPRSLRVRKAVQEAREIPPPRESRRLGKVQDPEALFAEEKRRIWAKLGDISGLRVPLNRILIAVWVPDADRKVGSLLLPDVAREEDKWQGKAGLVVKMGPRCYEDNEAMTFLPEDKCQVGDWVLFRKGDGHTLELWHAYCVMLESERGIKMILDRPDAVF